MDNKFVCVENQCVGCMSCVEVCPKQAVKIVDTLESYNAVIDVKKCVNCNACHAVCQNINPPTLIDGQKIYNLERKARQVGLLSRLLSSL